MRNSYPTDAPGKERPPLCMILFWGGLALYIVVGACIDSCRVLYDEKHLRHMTKESGKSQAQVPAGIVTSRSR